MRIIDILKSNNDKFSFSIEITPPKRGMSLEGIFNLVEQIKDYHPLWVDVTAHSAEVDYIHKEDGFYQRRVWKKSPGTLGICAAIKFKYGVETVPHLLCTGFTREETEDSLIDINFLGIQNVMALRGDDKFKREFPLDRTANLWAVDLISQIMMLNQGQYINSTGGAATNFSIGVAAYPEKHIETPNFDYDLRILKEKEQRGATYAVSQMFFDNQKFFAFEQMARESGVHMPVIPGIKVLTNNKQISGLPKTFSIEIPDDLVGRVETSPHKASEIGVEWALHQCRELIDRGHRHIHFYVMQNATNFLKIIEILAKEF